MKYLQILATIALIAILLGIPTVNVEHFINPPSVSSIIHPDTVVTTRGILGNKIDITIPEEAMDTKDVDNVITVLRLASSSDTIVFHLRGNGGDMETFIYLINNIKLSKAKISAIVEGDVYSGHAFLASTFKNIIMMPNTFMMFHTASGYGIDCGTVDGTDRTVSNVEHCQAMLNQVLALSNDLVNSISFLTKEEKNAILHGHDVYITAAEFNIRQKDMGKATYAASDSIKLPKFTPISTIPFLVPQK